MRINERFERGTVIRLQRQIDNRGVNREERIGGKETETIIFTVLDQYPHFVLVARSPNYRECVTNAELITVGLATQYMRPAAADDTPEQIKYEFVRKERKCKRTK